MRRLAGGSAILLGLLLTVPAAPAFSAQPGELDGFEYVALGDSYSAGFGLIPFSATSPFAATPPSDPNGCYQGDANYPHLVAADYALAITDQTCSGAVTPNIGYVAGASLTLPPSGSLTLLPQLTTASLAQTTMSGQAYPGLQADALSATTDIVTVAIGGNDIGFSDIAESCMRTATGGNVMGMLLIAGYSVPNCQDVYDSADPTYENFQLADRQSTYITPRIAAVFDEIAAKAPNAQVFVVGYPQIAPADATDACFSGGFPPFSDGVPFSGVDLSYIHQVESALNGAMRAEATARGFHYVDTWAASATHTICDGADSWINKLDIQNAASAPDPPCPANWLPLGYQGVTYFCMQLGALHPTADGVAMLHELTSGAIGDVFRIAVSGDPTPGGSLTVVGGGYYPGETIDVWLHSTPRQLGTAIAGADGSFSATFALRGDDPVGAHTVIATGQSSAHRFSAPVTIALAATGSAGVATPLILALVLITAGFLLLSARRARPSAPAR